MATAATPASGVRNGAGPEWGGFEENIQVLRVPAASSPPPPAPRLTAVPSVAAVLARGVEVGSIATPSDLSESATRKSVVLVLT